MSEKMIADSEKLDETEENLSADSGEVDDENRPDRSDSEEDLGPDESEVEETFPREYVEKLRDENAKYRQRAQRADDLANRLHTELVRATGRLADPEDLDYAEEHLDDPEALTAAVEDLLGRKPHLASRRPRGDVGQGHTSTASVDLASILRAAAS